MKLMTNELVFQKKKKLNIYLDTQRYACNCEIPDVSLHMGGGTRSPGCAPEPNLLGKKKVPMK